MLLSQPKYHQRRKLLHYFFYYKEATKQTVCDASYSTTYDTRWTARYSLKIWMFKGQYKFTKKEEKGIADIHLELIKEIDKYKEQNQSSL